MFSEGHSQRNSQEEKTSDKSNKSESESDYQESFSNLKKKVMALAGNIEPFLPVRNFES